MEIIFMSLGTLLQQQEMSWQANISLLMFSRLSKKGQCYLDYEILNDIELINASIAILVLAKY